MRRRTTPLRCSPAPPTAWTRTTPGASARISRMRISRVYWGPTTTPRASTRDWASRRSPWLPSARCPTASSPGPPPGDVSVDPAEPPQPPDGRGQALVEADGVVAQALVGLGVDQRLAHRLLGGRLDGDGHQGRPEHLGQRG